MADNLVWGWSLVLGGLGSGVLLSPVFLRDEIGGGYTSLRRRFLRLGHVAAVMLGALNILAALSGASWSAPLAIGSAGMAVGCLAAALHDRVKFALPAFAGLLVWGCIQVLRRLA